MTAPFLGPSGEESRGPAVAAKTVEATAALRLDQSISRGRLERSLNGAGAETYGSHLDL